MKRPTIYISSRIIHHPKWIELEKEYNFVSSWIHEARAGASTDLANLAISCLEEAAKADYTILYVEENDIVEFALIEVGAALVNGKIVVIVGNCNSISRLLDAHSKVRRRASLPHALEYILSHYNRQEWAV